MPGWDNFYYLIGSASAGLIGLLFVVVSLSTGRDRETSLRGAALYMTPTVVNFAVVLSVSAVCLAPGLPLAGRCAAFAVATGFGLVNAVRACWGIAHPRRIAAPPHWSDIWTYGVAPLVIHLTLAVVIVATVMGPARWTAVGMGALLLVLLLLGVRNAWDLITWIAPARGPTAPPPVSVDSGPEGQG
jgi:hypothetical protein